jgi:Rrf2 family nitric oxide-sensitive transcriptional repressor
MEPDMALVPCFSPGPAQCAILPSCVLRTALREAAEAFLAQLDRYTLEDLAEPRARLVELLGIASPASAA